MSLGKRSLLVAAIVLATGLGVVALLLAHDIRAWRGTFRADALQYTVAPKLAAQRTAATTLPSSLSSSLLGVGGNQRWLEAMQKFMIAYQDTEGLTDIGREDYVLLHQGETALRRVTQDPNDGRASQAYGLLGVLIFHESLAGTGTDASLVQEAVTDFQDAVRLDPGDEPAKENLELGMRVLISIGKIREGEAAGTKTTKKHRGGYGEPAGEGY